MELMLCTFLTVAHAARNIMQTRNCIKRFKQYNQKIWKLISGLLHPCKQDKAGYFMGEIEIYKTNKSEQGNLLNDKINSVSNELFKPNL